MIMTNTNTEDELPQELKDFVDGVVQEKVDDGATFDEAKEATIEWLNGIATYLQKHQNGLQ
jgi:hypothetical protein